MDNDKMLIKKESFPVASQPLGGSLFFDVQKFEHAQRVAGLLCNSTMVPEHFRSNIGNCLIALNYADRLGADPFMLMQSMCVIHGKPGLEAKLIIGLINNCGRFEPVEFEEDGDLKEPKNDNDGCTAFAKDIKSGKILKGPKVDWRMVKAEGWLSKNGSKWKSMAPLMFRYRAAAFFGRVYCPEVTLGMQTREEIIDAIDMVPDNKGTYAPELTTLSGAEALKAALKGGHKAPEKVEIPTAEETFASPEYQQEKEVNNVQSPDSSSNGTGDSGNEPWNPETAELQQRYPADKAQAVKECAERLGIDPRGKVARVVHAEILEKAKAKPVDEAQLMLLEKYNELWVSASKLSKHWAQDSMDLKEGERPPEDRIGEWVGLVEEYAANEKM
jgi:hypothetical protein